MPDEPSLIPDLLWLTPDRVGYNLHDTEHNYKVSWSTNWTKGSVNLVYVGSM